jgi:hypothetical protein
VGYGNEMGKKNVSLIWVKKTTTKEQNNLLYLYALIRVYYIYPQMDFFLFEKRRNKNIFVLYSLEHGWMSL